jgi:hypothetical protein
VNFFLIRFARASRFAAALWVSMTGVIMAEAAAEKAPSVPAATDSQVSDFFSGLLPLAWQKRPQVVFNAYTEMTPEGRSRRVPTPDKPLYYYAPPAEYVQLAEVSGGEKPPTAASLEEAMRKALATNGYLPVDDKHPRPDVLIVFAFGSNGTGAEGITTADEIVKSRAVFSSPYTLKEAIDRARFLAGNKFADDLLEALKWEATFPSDPEGPPFGVFMKSYDSDIVGHFLEIAFHDYYFVTATAFDFGGVEKKQKVALWQTRLAVEAQGVSMAEILKPLIANTSSFLGRETEVPQWLKKRVDREGRVDVGTPTIVEEPKPGSASADKAGQR